MSGKTYSSGPNAEDRALEQWSSILVEKLESLKGDVKWQQPWFSENALSWPRNLSGREYNAGNAVMLLMVSEKNKYDLPVWATFNRLTSLNYKNNPDLGPIPLKDKDGNDLPRVMVNKGERSTPVSLTTFTVINKETKEHIPYEEYKELDADEKLKYNVFPKMHIYNVFNVSQSNLKEARPELYAKLQAECNAAKHERDTSKSQFPALDKMINDKKWVCPIDIAHRDNAYYSISRDTVFAPERAQFKDDESYAGTLYHEMSHSLGAADRFNRFNPPGGFDENARAREELIAEMSAALVSQREGALHYTKKDSIPYIKSWIDAIHEEPKFVKTVLNDVKKCTSVISQKLEEMKQEIANERALSEDRPVVQVREANVAKNVPEPPKEEQQEEVVVRRGFHR